jgi:protocatechuate 3,4-dioxygenase alpha subunit
MMPRILTPSQTAGPLFTYYIGSEALRHSARAGDWETVCIEGCIFDADGQAITREMMVEIWTSADFVRAVLGADGFYRVWITRPEPESLPDGRPLAPYFHFAAFGRGLARHIQTRIYLPGEASNVADPVLELVGQDAAQSLVAVRQPDTDALRFDIQLQGPSETPLFRY